MTAATATSPVASSSSSSSSSSAAAAASSSSATDHNLTLPSASTSTALAPSGPVLENGTTSLQELCDGLYAKIQAFLDKEPETELIGNVQKQTRHSMGVIEEALKRYSLSELSLSYNGGKDCLVLLILYLASLSRLGSSSSGPLPLAVESIYIVPSHPFAAVDSFVAASAFKYHLSLLHLQHESMRAAFAEYLRQRPQIRAIFVGTRRTDPHGARLSAFDLTDGGWPAFMRVHPVIDWHYPEIWTFIRELEIPYCELYDMGYTSLGGTSDTFPNPALKVEGTDQYRPAYELTEDEEERLGREKK